MRPPFALRPAAMGALLLLALPALAAPKYVIGSWVNVHASASANSPVLEHVVVNTPVEVRGTAGTMCDIAWGTGQHGFVACRLLGERALTLAEVFRNDGMPGSQYSPPRAFWLAPSMYTLFEAGMHFQQKLISAEQQKIENGEGDESDEDAAPVATPPKLVRFPVAEFDAMKAVLAEGVVAAPDRDPPLLSCAALQKVAPRPEPGEVMERWPSWTYPDAESYPGTTPVVTDCRVPELPALALPPVRASLFKSAAELLPGSADPERISAHFHIREHGKVTGAPRWVFDYDHFRFNGAWDIGRYALTLEQPVVEHVVGRTGLVGAYRWTPQVEAVPNPPTASCDTGLRNARMGKELLPGYPRVKDALLWFQAPAALPLQKAHITSRVLKPTGQAPSDAIEKAAVYDVDLDGDSIPDFEQWDLWGGTEQSGADTVPIMRLVFANIGGQWYPFDYDAYVECS
jgi:hypothetical protein